MKYTRITDTHVYFWGGEFSNWYSINFKHKDNLFFNTEQAFMWEKAIFFEDNKIAEDILKTSNPRLCKALGRNVDNYIDSIWSLVRYQIMIDVIFEKFNQNDGLKKILISTGNKIIVEGSPTDTIWGVGLHYLHDDILDESKWKGLNLLGEALMEVRGRL